jgi:hypothetical protein
MVAMRKLILLGLLVAVVRPVHAAKHVTVTQLEKTFAEAAAKHKADDELARQFGEFELTERLTDASRDRISASLHLGPQAIVALQLLADESAALDPPATELPARSAPDAATAQSIFNAAGAYVTKILPHLPDFLATRTTYSFDNSPQVFKENGWPVRAGLHLESVSSREITVRDDHERADPAPGSDDATAASYGPKELKGLQTWSEFGELLAVILVDAEKGKMFFHHWEQSTAGLVAVYRYTVPKSASHYNFDYCCISGGPRSNDPQGGGRQGRAALMFNMEGEPTSVFHRTPGYHGSIFIDPATGAILRFTVQAEMDEGPVSRVATVIEYGPVMIGDRQYMCPIRSLALTQGPAEFDPDIRIPQATMGMRVNDVVHFNETNFTDYHRLGATMRILTSAQVPDAPQP